MLSKKVLILGAKGMLGQALVQEFRATSQYEVVAWDKEDLDVANEAELKAKIFLLKPEIIINAVAYNAVDKIEEDELASNLAQKINSDLVKDLVFLANELKAILIHFSSDYVFKGVEEKGYAENDLPEALNKYGQTKLLGEKYLLEKASQFYLIRLSKLFSNFPAGPTSKKSFVELMLDLYNQGKREFALVDDEFSSPTYAPDLANFTRNLVGSLQPWGIYHGSNSGGCTWYGFGQEIFALKKYLVTLNPISQDKFPRSARRPNQSILLNTKMPLQRPWVTALEEALKNL